MIYLIVEEGPKFLPYVYVWGVGGSADLAMLKVE